ncbi:DUF6731 family protein [Microbulbifer sp. ZKSA006]|uniref:DUF6731 family protein n=1 Tax=Microbulbifer sp. ZKSA006 TaxID=3243390 RepID=UPI0040390561
MKVHAFKVDRRSDSAELESVLTQVEGEGNLRHRIRTINSMELRAESIERRDGIWLMDFVRIRTSAGPGRVSRDSEVEGFEFDVEGGFGEETAALYDPETGYILTQYNHHGVRAGIISQYLSCYDEASVNVFTFRPKLDLDVERRLARQSLTKKFAFTIDATKMTAQDRARGVSLSEALNFGANMGADKLKIEVSVGSGQDRSLSDRAGSVITDLVNMFGENVDAVKKLEVSGKEDHDSSIEVLDLLGHRLCVQFNDLSTGPDLRLPREQRWSALERARNGWQSLLTI